MRERERVRVRERERIRDPARGLCAPLWLPRLVHPAGPCQGAVRPPLAPAACSSGGTLPGGCAPPSGSRGLSIRRDPARGLCAPLWGAVRPPLAHPALLLSWMFEHSCLDTCCFGRLICMCFVFLCLHLLSAIEHVSHGEAL